MNLIKSRSRVADHGEVFTPLWLVEEMLETVSAEASSLSSRFLEPACGEGNFLRAILRRRYQAIKQRFETPEQQVLAAYIATSNIYGIELLPDNVTECRNNLRAEFDANFSSYGARLGLSAIDEILKINIIQGDARSLKNAQGGEVEIPSWNFGPDGSVKVDFFSLENLSDPTYADDSIFAKSDHMERLTPIRSAEIELDSGLTGSLQKMPSELVEKGSRFFFEVVLGNPPYQAPDDGHGNSALPIYQDFVRTAINFGPKFVLFVIPARWFVGGKGLDSFRAQMINDLRVSELVDFPDSSLVFPGTQIKNGVCYFLWDATYNGPCEIETRLPGCEPLRSRRFLREPGMDTFIRFTEGLEILRKVIRVENQRDDLRQIEGLLPGNRFSDLVSVRKPFGLGTQFRGAETEAPDMVKVYRNGGVGYATTSEVRGSATLLGAWKVFIPRASSGFDGFPHPIIGNAFIGAPGEACSETYLAIGPFPEKHDAEMARRYLETKIVRFLCLLNKPSQDTTRSIYRYVPKPSEVKGLSDIELTRTYGISANEMEFIDRLVA